MKISMINGSQKTGESNTGLILNKLNALAKEKHEVNVFNSGTKHFSNETFLEIISGDILILGFSLFVDSIPSNTLEMLIQLENTIRTKHKKDLIIYTIINNGFYEGKQNNIAFEIIKNWCIRSGVKFGGGIGQGAGEMIGGTKNIPFEKGPFINLWHALQKIIEKMETKESCGIIYLSPYYPRFMWRFMAGKFWHNLANKNGINIKEIIRKV